MRDQLDRDYRVLAELAAGARRWLLDEAAPLWSQAGWSDKGLFAERLLLNGQPDPSPRRVFVQARHIYSFTQIGRFGWKGPWSELVNASLDYLLTHARRSDGFFVHSFTHNGIVHDGRADLYDQAFMMFCFAHAGKALGRPELFDVAAEIASKLDGEWKKRSGGYYEGEIVDPTIRLQNPHMHLFEAYSALAEATGDAAWESRAREIAELCRDRFVDRSTGAIIEYFDNNLSPLQEDKGKIVEPGHCCEWAWLFEGMAQQNWSDSIQLSNQLVDFARSHGIDRRRNVMINEVLLDGRVHNNAARLWPQTERLKAALARLRRTGETTEVLEAVDAYNGLSQYLNVEISGLWRDKLREDGSWVEEPAPGSSLYHITCAYVELIGSVETLALRNSVAFKTA